MLTAGRAGGVSPPVTLRSYRRSQKVPDRVSPPAPRNRVSPPSAGNRGCHLPDWFHAEPFSYPLW